MIQSDQLRKAVTWENFQDHPREHFCALLTCENEMSIFVFKILNTFEHVGVSTCEHS